ncbi:hypothetical protein HHE03_03560 [Helicobacter heilmannii]|nr:hypothetical protein HHE014_14960 [Helicobacter heilmannii]CRF48779.1 hypothetical protein HHE03_03560 [Helicobacter heilmannii]
MFGLLIVFFGLVGVCASIFYFLWELDKADQRREEQKKG